MTIFLHDWADSGLDGLKSDFYIADDDLKGADILLASYTLEFYDGAAFVLFRRDGKLFEVHGGHCSCYGLENQWEPEETTAEAIRHRLEKGSWGEDGRVRDDLTRVLASLEA